MVVSMRWRLPRTVPLARSFVGALDLKLGVSIISLFAVLNKVAGAYGIIAVFSGGTVAQLTLYVYSIATTVVFLWGLKKISEENAPKTLVYAHLFALDHVISTFYTTLFAVMWFAYTPHDGRRVANSAAQRDMMEDAGKMMDDQARKVAAEEIWKSERGFAAAVLIFGWFVKVYFILCLYSFAIHLRRGTYHSLPLSRPMSATSAALFRSSSSYFSLPMYRGIDTSGTLAETLWEPDEDSMSKLEEGKTTGLKDGSGVLLR